MNGATSLLDASAVYGSSQEDEKRIRSYVKGLIDIEFKSGDRLGSLRDDPQLVKKYGKACGKAVPCKLVGKLLIPFDQN
jgi:hypothetical protein